MARGMRRIQIRSEKKSRTSTEDLAGKGFEFHLQETAVHDMKVLG